MAETITLRTYLDEVDSLLARGAATEVISHCRYILQHYPRNIETYRLLAQALLQKAQDQGIEALFGEAAEVFQRVLGVMPNDYVAHLGLSEIREHENRLDQAIWHMERAYEQIPGNQLLQAALRGLYTKRDGEGRAPEKIHLTRGALARQYVTGQLYDQALIELRHALDQNPSRLDLQVMLAETLWESHHPVEAGEMAVQILKKLPDCLPANRILARLWLDNERPSDAQFFLDRVEALDPYAAAEVLQPDADIPDPNLLRRLDYSTEAQATLSQETPDWIQDLGDLGGADVSAVFQMPPSAPAPSETAAPAVSEQTVSFDWFQEQAGASPDVGTVPDWFASAGQAAAEESPAAPETELPDWFAELGGRPDTGAAAPGPVEADWLSGLDTTDDLFGAENAATEADWLAGDFGALEKQPAGDSVASTDVSADAGSELEWVIEDEAVSADQPIMPESAPTDDWLGDFGSLEAQPAAAKPTPLEEDTEEDWLSGFGAVDVSSLETVEESTSDEFDWSLEESLEPSPAVVQPEDSEVADWWATAPESAELFSEAAEDDTGDASDADTRSPSGFTELLAGIDSSKVQSEESVTADNAEVVPPEWLTAFGDESPQREQAWDWEETEEPVDAQLSAFTPPADGQPQTDVSDELEVGNIPDWLIEPESDFFALPSEPAQKEEQAADDWFSELETSVETKEITDEMFSEVSVGERAAVEVPELMTFEPAQDEELVAEATDDWFSELETSVETAEITDEMLAEVSAGEQADEEQVELDFMTALDQAGDEWTSVEIESPDDAAPASEVPDWLRAASPEEDQPVAEAEPDEMFDVEEIKMDFGHEEVIPAVGTSKETPVVEDWMDSQTGEQFDIGEEASEVVLDWLQPQAAEGDWLGAFVKSDQDDAVKEEAAPLAMFESLEETTEESAPAEDMARKTDEWLAAIPDVETPIAADESETVAFEDVESTLFGDEEFLGKGITSTSEPEKAESLTFDLEEDTSAAEAENASFEAGEIPLWMSDLEPVELEDEPKEEELFGRPYDPFEGGSAANVPEYHSAKETGILQPDESPDWMAAFGDEEVAIELGVGESTEGQVESDERESLLAALGIETEHDKEPEIEAEVEFVDLAEEAAPVVEEKAPEIEEGAIPDWLAAITTSATEQFEDLRFEEPETYSSSAEASGVVSDSDLDWLAPLGAENNILQPEEAREKLDLDAIFSDVETFAETAEESTEPDAELAELDFELAADTGRPVEDSHSWFTEDTVEAEAESSETAEEDEFAFEFPEIQVAQPDNLAHTRELEESDNEDESEMPWLDEEDEVIPDDFTFEELTPRWLRHPKESSRQAPAQEHDAPSGAPDWLRDVFEDDESDK